MRPLQLSIASIRRAALIGGLVTAAFIAGPVQAKRYPVIQSAEGAKGVIANTALEGARVERAQFAMAYEHGEYALFRKGDTVAEVVYDTAIDGGTEISLQYRRTVERMVQEWHHNNGNAVAFGTQGSVKNGYDEIAYTAFTHGSGRACVGFMHEWDFPPSDSEDYPSKLLFGYMCTMQKSPLSQTQIETFLNGFDIQRMEAGASVLPDNGAASADSKALALGKGSKDFGHPEFPFDYGFPFMEDTGDDRSN